MLLSYFKYLLAFSVSLLFVDVMAQNQKMDLHAQIIDKENGEPLAYATVLNLNSGVGTASSLEGWFDLPGVGEKDSLVVSYIGFKTDTLIASQVGEIIYLEPQTQIMSELVVTAQDKQRDLYKLIAKLPAQNHQEKQHAKSYYYLETFLNNQRVETLESYYNGEYKGYDIKKLDLKKGRIGLKPIQGRYYLSTETSKTFRYHSLFTGNYLFPENPLSLPKRRMKKIYDLSLRYTMMDHGYEILVVDFTPKKADGQYFSGTLWINNDLHTILKAQLQIQNATIIPFKAIGLNTIDRMDMEITKNFDHSQGDNLRLSSMDFNYTVRYIDRLNRLQVAESQAFISAYDYEELWELPAFDFTETIHEDYRNITLTDYDPAFWSDTEEFRFFEKQETIDRFITENHLNQGFTFPESNSSQLQYPYIHWSEKRLRLREASQQKIQEQINAGVHRNSRYALGVKLYLDINEDDEGLRYELHTIIDPVDTYYYFFMNPEDHAFINIYFDLMEIEKRELINKIEQLEIKNRSTINQLYAESINQFELKTTRLKDETNRGQNIGQLRWWNDLINNSLGINNFEQFSIE